MAGGEGTRLRPLTSNAPKPMMPIANRPMMEHIIDLLKKHGFDDIVVTVAFMANHIRNYFGDGSDIGVRMVYATEESPLGTAGSVRNAREELDERFLVISGDVLTDIDLGSIVRFHEERGAMATIGLVPVEDPLEFGIVITREDGSIERFLEKPTWGQVFSDTINTGIFVLEPEIFDYIAPDGPVDFSSDVFPKLLEDGRDHLADPSAIKHFDRNADKIVKRQEEADLIEAQHDGGAQRDARCHVSPEPCRRTLVQEYDQDAVDEQLHEPAVVRRVDDVLRVRPLVAERVAVRSLDADQANVSLA